MEQYTEEQLRQSLEISLDLLNSERAHYNAQLSLERDKWAERNDIHTESSRIVSNLAGAVRAGADDETLARILRQEITLRTENVLTAIS